MSELLPESCQRVLVTGGAGFIGGALVRRLLADTNAKIFTLDKCGYASDLTSIELALKPLGSGAKGRHQLLRVDLADAEATAEAVHQADPDLVLHLAAESHVDRSIAGPGAFISSNVNGTFHLLQAVRSHWETLPEQRHATFRFHHISTDEVFGSLGPEGHFSETTPYDPRSPYSASKAASDHLVRAWHHTYGLLSRSQLQQQLRALAVPGEVDTSGNSQGGGRKADSALWRWLECARLAVCGRSRRSATDGSNARATRSQLLRWRQRGTQ